MSGEIILTSRARLTGAKLSAALLQAALNSIAASFPEGAIGANQMADYLLDQVGSVANVAALAALDPASVEVSGFWITVQGKTTAFDGNGGVFVWDSTSSATEDGTDIIASDVSAAGRWRRITASNALAAGSITSTMLADESVIEPKGADDSVSARTLIASAVTTGKILDEAVKARKLSAGVVASMMQRTESAWVLGGLSGVGTVSVAHGLTGSSDGGFLHDTPLTEAPIFATGQLKLASGVGSYVTGDVIDVTQIVRKIVYTTPTPDQTETNSAVRVGWNATDVVVTLMAGETDGTPAYAWFLEDGSAITIGSHYFRVVAFAAF